MSIPRRRAAPQATPIDWALEQRISRVIMSLIKASDDESRISAWRAFEALRSQRTAEHVQALEAERLRRLGLRLDDGATEDEDESEADSLGDLLREALLGERAPR